MTNSGAYRDVVDRWRAALYDFEPDAARKTLNKTTHLDASFRLSIPFETLQGADTFMERAILPLAQAWPDLERRDTIVVAGSDGAEDWVGCAGHYVGTFSQPWFDIPPTGHVAHLRFHEFYRIKGGQIAEMQALWDIPEVMMQAGALSLIHI